MGTVNIILDSRIPEKYDNLIYELNRQKIADFEIFPCLIYPDVVSSINASHKMIVQKAKDENKNECCIMEDDCMFPSENGWQYFLDNKPMEFDIYSAGNYMAFKRPEKPCIMKVDCIVGLHLYFIHSKYYDNFLATANNKHIDTEQKGDLYVCYPMPALQRAGFSANNKSMTNYNAILSTGDIYQ